MQETHVDAIERTIHKTNEWLKEIQAEMGAPDRHAAYNALRATLHTLRDRLSPDEALHLGAELPTLVRGVYFEGWRLHQKGPRVRTAEGFLDAVLDESGRRLADAEGTVRAVLRVLARKVADGEIADIKAGLPQPLRDLWP